MEINRPGSRDVIRLSDNQGVALRAAMAVEGKKMQQGMEAPHGQLKTPEGHVKRDFGATTGDVWNKKGEQSKVPPNIITARTLKQMDGALSAQAQKPTGRPLPQAPSPQVRPQPPIPQQAPSSQGRPLPQTPQQAPLPMRRPQPPIPQQAQSPARPSQASPMKAQESRQQNFAADPKNAALSSTRSSNSSKLSTIDKLKVKYETFKEFNKTEKMVNQQMKELQTKLKLTDEAVEHLYNRSHYNSEQLSEMSPEEIKSRGLTSHYVPNADDREKIVRLFVLKQAMAKDPDTIKGMLSEMIKPNADPVYESIGHMNFVSYVCKAKDGIAASSDPIFKNTTFSDKELGCMYGYTCSDFKLINGSLRAAKGAELADPGLKSYVDNIVSGMSKLPDHEGVVRRTIIIGPPDPGTPEEKAAWKKENLSLNNPHPNFAFSSTTTKEPTGGAYKIEYVGPTGGKDFGPISAFNEGEILIPPGKKFIVFEADDVKGQYKLRAG